MAWQTISEDDLREKMAAAEVSALQTAALATGQANPITGTIARVVDEVRGYIAAGGFSLEDGAYIPSKLVDATLTIVAWRAAMRLNVKSILSEARRSEYDQALQLLRLVATGKFAIEEPTTVEDEALGAPSPSMADKTLTRQPSNQDGI
jgi:hypothetical protein